MNQKLRGFIVNNFASVCEEAEFDDLEYEDLKEIIQRDNLCVNSEEDVLYAVVKWVDAKEESRSHYMPVLLQYIRLENTTLEFLYSLQQDPRVAKCAHCLTIVQNAQGKLVRAHVKQEPADRASFDGLEQVFFQSGDSLGNVSRRYDDEERIKRKLLEEFLHSESKLPEWHGKKCLQAGGEERVESLT